MQQHILVRGKTNKLLEKPDRMRNGEPGPCASGGNLTPRVLARELASQLCHSTLSAAWARGPSGLFLSHVVLGVLHTGQELLGRKEYVHFWWRGSTAGKYWAVLDADGTP